MRLAGILAVAVAVASCGGGSSPGSTQGTATFSGTIRGTSMTPRDASAAVVSFSANGVSGKAAVATSGQITVTAVGNRYAGSYQLTFDFGDTVSGTFDAPVCANVDVSQAG